MKRVLVSNWKKPFIFGYASSWGTLSLTFHLQAQFSDLQNELPSLPFHPMGLLPGSDKLMKAAPYKRKANGYAGET